MRVILSNRKMHDRGVDYDVCVVVKGKRVKCGRICWNPADGQEFLVKLAKRKARSAIALQQN